MKIVGRTFLLLAVFASILLSPSLSRGAGPDAIDYWLMDEPVTEQGRRRAVARAIYKMCLKRGYESVGVLPFYVAHGNKKPTLTGQLMSANLAKRLERAITLFADFDNVTNEHKPFYVVYDPLAQAQAKSPGINFTNNENVKRLFRLNYKTPVSTVRRKLDALIVGIAKVSEDWTTCSFQVGCFQPDGKLVMFTSEFWRGKGGQQYDPDAFHTDLGAPVRVDLDMLRSLGSGYSKFRLVATRGKQGAPFLPFYSGPTEIVGKREDDKSSGTAKAQTTAREIPVAKRVSGKPLAIDPWKNAPVRLELLYNNKIQPLLSDGLGSSQTLAVRDPGIGDVIQFRVTNQTDARVGLVLSVDGISSLFGQEAHNADLCNRWVLEPKQTRLIRGLYARDMVNFKPYVGAALPADGVVSLNAGLIQMTVYGQLDKEADEIIEMLFAGVGQPNGDGNGASSSNTTGSATAGSATTGSATLQSSSVPFGGQGATSNPEGEFEEKVSMQLIKQLQLSGSSQGGATLKVFRGGTLVDAKATLDSKLGISKAATWKQLQLSLTNGLVDPSAPRRAFIAPSGESKQTKLREIKLGKVQRIDDVTIRYLTVAKEANGELAAAMQNLPAIMGD